MKNTHYLSITKTNIYMLILYVYNKTPCPNYDGYYYNN